MNLSGDEFDNAISEFVSIVGEDNVFVGEGLSDYVDPYDIWEADEQKRKTPSAAVWYVKDEQVHIVRSTTKKAVEQPGVNRRAARGVEGCKQIRHSTLDVLPWEEPRVSELIRVCKH